MAWFDFFRKRSFTSSRKVVKTVDFDIDTNDYTWLCPDLRFIRATQFANGKVVFDFHWWEPLFGESQVSEMKINPCDVHIKTEIIDQTITKITFNRPMLIQNIYYQGHAIHDLLETSFELQNIYADFSPVQIIDKIIMSHFNELLLEMAPSVV